MIIPAKSKPRWAKWVILGGMAALTLAILFVSIFMLSYRFDSTLSQQSLMRVLPLVLPGLQRLSPSPIPSPITPQRTGEFLRGVYRKLEGNTLELAGTAGGIEKIRIEDRTQFTCITRYMRDAKGNRVDMTNTYFTAQSKSAYTWRPNVSTTPYGRLMFERVAKPGDIVLVTLDNSEITATWVNLFTDPCEPERWRL